MRTILHSVAALGIFMAGIQAQVPPQMINYQGRVVVGTTNFDGSGLFRFALVNANGSTTYWSNDGTSTAGSQPVAAVTLPVIKGLYSVLLGDTALANMTAVPTTVFNNADVRLRVWFNDGTNGPQLLTPDQRIAAVGYAMVAGNVPNGAITSAQIAPGAVTNTQLGAGAVQISNLAAGTATSGNSPGTLVLRDGGGNFVGQSIIALGAFNMPSTLNAGTGLITQNDVPLLHTFGTGNFFAGTAAGNLTMTGAFNTATGHQALTSNTTGAGNTASGHQALFSNTSGNENTATGFLALRSNTTGSANTATGYHALHFNTSGLHNAAHGFQALYLNTEGAQNTASGFQALRSNTTGSFNAASGAFALYSNTEGASNLASGNGALQSNTTTGQNVALGNNALFAQSFDAGAAYATHNVAVGFEALRNNQPTSVINGNRNTALGAQALMANTQGAGNTASGFRSLFFNSTGGYNTAEGFQALFENTTGSHNTASGSQALQNNTTAGQNVAIGDSALLTQSFDAGVVFATNNVAVGFEALRSNQPTSVIDGNRNTALGAQALMANTTGPGNTASGFRTLFSNSTGARNTAGGFQALFANTTGTHNTASGAQALQNNTTAGRNVALGDTALFTQSFSNGGVTWNSDNVAVGYEALFFNQPSDRFNGFQNTAVGTSAMRSNTTGSTNTAIGVAALNGNLTGNRNTAIGHGADVSSGALTNATAVGYDAVVDASNKVRIGNTAVTVIQGQVGFTASSDRNAKENFQPVDGAEVLRKIREFRLTSWNYIGHDPKEFRHYGPMAQDFYEAFGQDAVGTIGTPTTINSGDMAGILMSAVQALDAENATLRAEAAATNRRHH